MIQKEIITYIFRLSNVIYVQIHIGLDGEGFVRCDERNDILICHIVE